MHKAVEQKLAKQAIALEAYAEQGSITAAAVAAGVSDKTVHHWKKHDQGFADALQRIRDEQAALRAERDKATSAALGMMYDHLNDEQVGKGSFRDWRPKYIGRQVEPHQSELVDALEDYTNLVIFCLLPPGAGKDTTAGDYLLYETCDDREKRAAWVMKGEQFARRRVAERLDPYLTDPKTYLRAPPGPTSVKPSASLIEDYGPFKYKPGMVDGDGVKLEPTTWTKNEIYFLKANAPEADPNLWATGMEGQIYGSRIDSCVISDVFDRENQMSPMAREGQFNWVMGTLLSRLDESGRLVVLGTRCLPDDNYIRLMEAMIGDAPVVYQGDHYTKYANGVATIIMPAIQYDEHGEEKSYWPDRFPLDSQYQLPDGTRIPVDDDDPAQEARLKEQYGPMIQRIRGLREIRDRDPQLFDTMYQQNPPEIVTGDFTDATLDAADDPTRTLQVYRPKELLVVGADPARSAGAAWVCWGVDREQGTITLVDVFYGEKLGIGGLKHKLVINPVTTYKPVWFCYEVNREAAVVEDPEIQQVFNDFGTNLYRHHTSKNRSSQKIGVPSLSFYMRSKVIRWPTQTADDRKKTDLVKQHFKTWDRKEALQGNRTNIKGHPDDIAMAAWVGFIKALELLEKGAGSGVRQMAMPVPKSVQAKWDRLQQRNREKQYIRDREKEAAPTISQLVSLVLGGNE